ncbi:SurA N-terminal domain-containing protein [Azonexus caeni]|uniref:SurA N-terminal domain-containing protein n=1 Tax=Azonexus caeni TaxID=266126 RepID=UPI003A8BE52A
MFDAVRNNKRIVQGFLVLIMLPFAFFGLDSYFNGGGAGAGVAKVGDVQISQQEYQQALREQQDRVRSQVGQVDPKMFENPAFRKAILDDLINRRLLLIEAGKRRLYVSDEAVRNAIASIEAFHENGKFSTQRYEALLRGQGMSPQGFEAQVRQDMTLQRLAGSIGQSGVLSTTVGERVLALQTEQRDVQEILLGLDAYLGKVKLADDAARKFYDENGKRFETPDQARAEFVVLSQDGLEVKVSDEEIKAWYDGHKDRYQQPEERRASHVLIATEGKDKAQARAKAEQVLKDVQATPAAFAEIAKKNSDDPGSAGQGGDLGFFGRGMMVKPFDDAVFALKEGETSGIVESDFGFHIIRLTGVRAAREKPLAEVRGEIEKELKASAASRKFAEAAEAFSNAVYEQSDSLQPAADQFKLKVQQSGWLGRQADPANGPLANAKLLAALFSDDAIKNKRNTEAVEIAPNTLAAARIVEYKPAALQPFDSVKAEIETLLRNEEAFKLAVADGQSRLAELKKGEDKQAWGAAKRVSRMDASRLPPPAVPAVFRMNTDKLPSYAGVEIRGTGYMLYRLNKVEAGEKLDDVRRQGLLGQLRSLAAQEDMQMYVSALRSRYKVEINEKALNSSDR